MNVKLIAEVSGVPVIDYPLAGGFTTDELGNNNNRSIDCYYVWSWQDDICEATDIEIIGSHTFYVDYFPTLKIRAVVSGLNGTISNLFVGKLNG